LIFTVENDKIVKKSRKFTFLLFVFPSFRAFVMNRHLAQDILESGRFMTLFFMTIDPERDRIEWVRAGHDPAIIYDAKRDEFQELVGGGVALGVNDSVKYETNQRDGITDGQIIAIGTDGIWEATGKAGEMFGKARFREIIRNNSHASAEDILNAVYNEL
jgi:sigma-B regulation protein RsbU (phosphoserine phosphatase)